MEANKEQPSSQETTTTKKGRFTTKLIELNPNTFSDSELIEAAEYIRNGELVAFPTETVYGLGANALDSKAVTKIFEAKGRPQDNPLIVHVSDMTMVSELVESIPPSAELLAKTFWPGPLTLVFKKKKGVVPDGVTAGLQSVAIRMPANPIARKLIAISKVPIAAPSANLSGRPSPTTAQHVWNDLSDRGCVPIILDGGPCLFGVESTVVDVECSSAAVVGGGSGAQKKPKPIILRPGGLTLEKLQQVIPEMGVYSKLVHGTALAEKPATPGLKYRHYAPTAPVILFDPGCSGGFSTSSDHLRERVAAEAVKEWLEKFRGCPVSVLKTHTGTDSWPYDVHCAGHSIHQPSTLHSDAPSSSHHHHHQYQQPEAATTTATHSNTVFLTTQQQLQQVPSPNSLLANVLVPPTTTPSPTIPAHVHVLEIGDERTDLAGIEHGLFDALRVLDTPGVAAILVEGVAESGEGLAIMNRLRKAAAQIIDVSSTTPSSPSSSTSTAPKTH